MRTATSTFAAAIPRHLPVQPVAVLPALRSNLHFVVAGVAALALLPALVRLRLPLVWPWPFIVGFTRFVVLQSICAASVLYVIERPAELRVVGARYRNRLKATLLAAFCGVLVWALGLHISTMCRAIDALAVVEFLERKREGSMSLLQSATSVVPAAAYLVVGFLLVFTYNDVIVSVRFYGAYDQVLNQLDAHLFGTTVSAIAHRTAEVLPSACFRLAELLYFNMFAQLGATVLICAFSSGAKRAVKFVGAILLVQSLALMLFYLWPSHGPYYTCVNHFERLRFNLDSYAFQKEALRFARGLWEHQPIHVLRLRYYLAFPCTHVAQPLIVLWFLRRWKRMVAVLAVYDVFLVPAILMLEWHYFVDMLGGIAIAAVVIWIVGDTAKGTPRQQLCM